MYNYPAILDYPFPEYSAFFTLWRDHSLIIVKPRKSIWLLCSHYGHSAVNLLLRPRQTNTMLLLSKGLAIYYWIGAGGYVERECFVKKSQLIWAMTGDLRKFWTKCQGRLWENMNLSFTLGKVLTRWTGYMNNLRSRSTNVFRIL